MASIQTFVRTVVMLATLGLLAKLWYHHGPTVEELQVIGVRVAEIAQQTWTDYWQSRDANSSLAGEAPVAPAPFSPPSNALQPIHAEPSATRLPAPSPIQLASAVAAPPLAPATSAASDPVQRMLDELTQWGVRDSQLEPWGTSGRLYRFSCSAPWARSPSFSRHFEAVADSRLAAVEQVAAEIRDWRGGQQH